MGKVSHNWPVVAVLLVTMEGEGAWGRSTEANYDLPPANTPKAKNYAGNSTPPSHVPSLPRTYASSVPWLYPNLAGLRLAFLGLYVQGGVSYGAILNNPGDHSKGATESFSGSLAGAVTGELNVRFGPLFLGGGIEYALANFEHRTATSSKSLATSEEISRMVVASTFGFVSEDAVKGKQSEIQDPNSNEVFLHQSLKLKRNWSLFLQGGIGLGRFLLGARTGVTFADIRISRHLSGMVHNTVRGIAHPMIVEASHLKDIAKPYEATAVGAFGELFGRWALTDHLDIEVGYRYTHFLELSFDGLTSGTVPKDLGIHQIRAGIGIRF